MATDNNDTARFLESLSDDEEEKLIIRLIGKDVSAQDILKALMEREAGEK